MTKNLFTLAAATIALGLASSPALATSNRTFVSGTGTDTGTCALTAPCRTFAFALTQTSPSGEIIVLSSAGYGAVTITQSVSIINTSNFAGVTVAGGNAITINAGASDSVTLRGLSLDGGGTVGNGIVFNSGGSLTVDQSDVMNFAGFCPTTDCVGHGILIQPTSGNHNIVITNTTLSNNVQTGVFYYPLSGNATTGIVIDRINAISNGSGIASDNSHSSGAAKISISNSNASANGFGILIYKATTVSVDASSASNNGSDGIYLGAGTLALGRSALMNNGGYGLEISGGTVNSYKDNRIAGNGSGDVVGTPAVATLY
jgi:hypothetical protein